MQRIPCMLNIAAAAIALALSLPDASAQQTEHAFRLDVANGIVPREQRAMRVTKGTRVKLVVASDAAGELHVHGYRIAMKITPGRESETVFDAYATGRYSLEWHGESGHANRGHHAPPLAVLEVHPK